MILLQIVFIGCSKSDFADNYTDPSKIQETTVEKQFTGFLQSNKDYVLQKYWNYFTLLSPSVNTYNQAIGWVNSEKQYLTPSSGNESRWKDYYNFLAQEREFEKVFASQTASKKTDNRIFMIAARIYFYDHTQKVVDIHGDIPWTEAGMLSANSGDYSKSYAKFDDASTIYTKMLDDLKMFSDELNTITLSKDTNKAFRTQDIVNRGDLTLWKKYCNSLRLRILTRVSAVASFTSRADTEIASILADQGKYPLILTNSDNVQINIFDSGSPLVSDYKTPENWLEDGNGNIAGKVMIDHMNANSDPRLKIMFEPGASAAGAYIGLDPMLLAGDQGSLVSGGTLAIYNRSTLSRNKNLPGVLINSAEVQFLLAEYHLKNNIATAKMDYEQGIRNSIEYYVTFRSISADNVSGPFVAPTATEINNYLASAGVKFDVAATKDNLLKLIATQKWIHYSVMQPIESWAETRRLNVLNFNFWVDANGSQKTPPSRLIYPSSEQTYNTANYAAVSAKDTHATKIFWDVK